MARRGEMEIKNKKNKSRRAENIAIDEGK